MDGYVKAINIHIWWLQYCEGGDIWRQGNWTSLHSTVSKAFCESTKQHILCMLGQLLMIWMWIQIVLITCPLILFRNKPQQVIVSFNNSNRVMGL